MSGFGIRGVEILGTSYSSSSFIDYVIWPLPIHN
jgi:hypothetical protein